MRIASRGPCRRSTSLSRASCRQNDNRDRTCRCVGTVGLIENRPNSRNVIPGEVFFTIDLRHPDDEVVERMEARMRAVLPAIFEPLRLTYDEKRIWMAPASPENAPAMSIVTMIVRRTSTPA